MCSVLDAYNKAIAQRRLDRERDREMHKNRRRAFQRRVEKAKRNEPPRRVLSREQAFD